MPKFPKMFIDHETMTDLVFDARMNRHLWKPFINGEITKSEFSYIRYLNKHLGYLKKQTEVIDSKAQ